MPVWYWEKKDLIRNSPSAKDGIDWETESKLRKEGVSLIFEVGSRMKLPYETWATGAVYFHRFYVFRSFKHYAHRVVAISCLFLAGKVEETPKKGKDLLKVVKEVTSESDFSVFGDDSKETLILMERIILKTIQFDLHVSHPYSFLIKLLKQFKGSKEYKAPIAQQAWTFINDSFCTTLCLQWEPDIIAAAMLYLATKMKKDFTIELLNPPIGFDGKWWKIFVSDLGQAVIEDVCHQQLDYLSGNFGGSVAKKKKKRSPSSASSTPGPTPGPSAPLAPPNDKRKAPALPTTPYELTSKKLKSDDGSMSSTVQMPDFAYPPPPPLPAGPPPPLPPPPPPTNIPPPPGGSSIPVHSSRGARPISRPHSPGQGQFADKQPMQFEGQPIQSLVPGSSGGTSCNSGLQHSTSAANIPTPAFVPHSAKKSDSRSPSPIGNKHQPLRRSTSTNEHMSYQESNGPRRDENPRDFLGTVRNNDAHTRWSVGSLDADNFYGSGREDDRFQHNRAAVPKPTASFQSNVRIPGGSRFDCGGGGSSSGSSSSATSLPPSAERPRLPQNLHQIKQMASLAEPGPGFRNSGANGNNIDLNSSGSFHPTFSGPAAAFSQQQRSSGRSSPTPLENLVAAVSAMPRPPLGQGYNSSSNNPNMMPPISLPPMSMPPPMMARPNLSSPTLQPANSVGNYVGGGPPSGLTTRTPSTGHRPNFSSMHPSLLPPRL